MSLSPQRIVDNVHQLIQAFRFEEAQDMLEQAENIFPDDEQLLFECGRFYRICAQFGKSLRNYQTILQKHPDRPLAYVGIAENFLLLQQTDEASEIIKHAKRTAKTAQEIERVEQMGQTINDIRNGQFNNKVHVVVETLPRSGTGFFLRSIINHAGLNYATVFINELRMKYLRSGCIAVGDAYLALPLDKGYALKTHFFRPLKNKNLLSPHCDHVPLISFFLDSIYSWAEQERSNRQDPENKKYEGYKVTENSKEWASIVQKLPGLYSWLDAMPESEVIRYEDLPDQNNRLHAIAARYGTTADRLFTGFSPDHRRIYYGRPPSQHFDKAVLDFLLKGFAPYFKRFYPEYSMEGR